MTKIVKSYSKLVNNFQDDLKGSFFFKLKRRQRTLNLLAWRFILNKVKPIRLDDLLLPRLKRRSINSFYTIQLRKLRFFYGFYRGYKSVFFKRLHCFLSKVKFNRVEKSLSLLELRLDVLLVRTFLFSNVLLARRYINKFGVVVNGKIVYNINYVLKINDVFSVLPAHRIFFKTKLLLKLNPVQFNINFLKAKLGINFINYKRFIFSDVSNFGTYERILSSFNSEHFDLDNLRKSRSLFFLSYFPRFLEFNFKNFEFVYNLPLRSFADIKYPFKLKSFEIKRLIESTF